MSRKSSSSHCLSTLVFAAFTCTCLLSAQTRNPGGGSGYGQIVVSKDIHHDRSLPLRDVDPSPVIAHPTHIKLEGPLPIHRGASAAPGPLSTARLSAAGSDEVRSKSVVADLVNGSAGVVTNLSFFNLAGVGEYFNGPQGSFTPTSSPSDATGAVGTTQYLQWADDAFAIFDKATGNALMGPVAGNTIWSGFGGACQNDNDGQPTVSFDKLANRWVVSQHAITGGPPYLQCVAVSTTPDATGTWNRYSFAIGDGYTDSGTYTPGWTNENPKLGVWPDGYYMVFDMYSGSTFEGENFCALQRANMINDSGAAIQCVVMDPIYFGVAVADLDSPTPPPAGAPAYFAAEDTYQFAIDFWKFHVDWSDYQNTTISFPIPLDDGHPYDPCSDTASFVGLCIPQPGTTTLLDGYGGRVTGRMPYRNYGSHQSLFLTETVGAAATQSGGPAAPTGVEFLEMRVNANGDLGNYQSGTFAPDSNFRFIPSIATDRAGNIAVAYNVSSNLTYPGQYAATRAASDPLNMLGNETLLNPGNASQTTSEWDTRSSLTVDPVDDCTYYYTQQYQPTDGTNNWSTQIEAFTLAGCPVSTVGLNTVPSGLMVDFGTGPLQLAPVGVQFSIGSSLSIGTEATQTVTTGTQYVFSKWSDGGALTHNVTVPSANTTFTATFNTQYQLTTAVGAAGGGTVTPASGSFFNSGSTVNLTATPAAGYGFASWTGAVANTTSATTTLKMSAPTTVTANFTPLSTWVEQALTGQSGPSNARVWTFSFTNKGPGQANNIVFNTFRLTQTAGTACTPVVLTSLPAPVGTLAVGQVTSGKITINFSSCPSNALFSLSTQDAENNLGSHATLNLTNLSQ